MIVSGKTPGTTWSYLTLAFSPREGSESRLEYLKESYLKVLEARHLLLVSGHNAKSNDALRYDASSQVT